MFGVANWGDLKKAASSAVNIASNVAKQAAVVARDIADDLTSFKALKDYKLAGHVATAGPCNCWKIFVAVSKKPGETSWAIRAADSTMRRPTDQACNHGMQAPFSRKLRCGSLTRRQWWIKPAGETLLPPAAGVPGCCQQAGRRHGECMAIDLARG